MTLSEMRYQSRIQDSKTIIESRLVKKLFHKQDNRGMTLCEFASRCVRAGELHELVTTTQHHLTPGERVDEVGFIGFIEISNAGVLEKGDLVFAGERYIGRISGFDECHYPNHYNVLIETEQLLTATDLNISVLETFSFIGKPDDLSERSS